MLLFSKTDVVRGTESSRIGKKTDVVVGQVMLNLQIKTNRLYILRNPDIGQKTKWRLSVRLILKVRIDLRVKTLQ